MNTKTRKPSQAVKDGQAAGAWLVTRAPHVLLAEYCNRNAKAGEASERLSARMEALRAALGAMANDPDVASALQALDGAIWDCAVEHEDRAWHAAWTVSMRLRGEACAHSRSTK